MGREQRRGHVRTSKTCSLDCMPPFVVAQASCLVLTGPQQHTHPCAPCADSHVHVQPLQCCNNAQHLSPGRLSLHTGWASLSIVTTCPGSGRQWVQSDKVNCVFCRLLCLVSTPAMLSFGVPPPVGLAAHPVLHIRGDFSCNNHHPWHSVGQLCSSCGTRVAFHAVTFVLLACCAAHDS